LLKELIKKELTSKDLVEVSNEELEAITKFINENFWWCLSRLELESCKTFERVVNEVIELLAKVRIQKYVEQDFKISPKSFDSHVLKKFVDAIIKFYRLSFKGQVDSDGTVQVKIKGNFRIGNRDYIENTITSLNIIEALALEILGLVEII